MKVTVTSRRSFATWTGLFFVASVFLCSAPTLNIHSTTASPHAVAKTRAAALPSAGITIAVKTVEPSTPPTTLDLTMAALTSEQARLYRDIFAAQAAGDWNKADGLVAALTDRRLLGHVLADRYERRAPTEPELSDWLKSYADLPEAEDMHALAHRGAKVAAPSAPRPWSAGYIADTAADFTSDISAGTSPPPTKIDRLANDINKALHRHDPETARNLFIAAENEQSISGTFVVDAEAAIAAGFFYNGEREQAEALANAAAVANQPSGLWIHGLIAWERGDFTAAANDFTRLADHPALNSGNRAAAAFWAYRALNGNGNRDEAKQRLYQAARQTGSFYGMLAAEKLGQKPTATVPDHETTRVFDSEQRTIISRSAAGWRALALLQVGETAMAEGELRRLSPQGNDELREAMLALANYVPMPALAVQLASLGGWSGDNASYPLPPWSPRHGFEVDRALLFALARHESGFDPDAVSGRGAVGLMQIMPSTARVMTSSADEAISLAKDDKLFDPTENLTLGQNYVRHLASLPQIGDNLMLLLAAYNGGPNSVTRWKQDLAAHDPLLFMETIPVRETRMYIARVLPHYWAYRARLAEPLTTLSQLADDKWPQIALTGNEDVRVASADDTGAVR